MDGHIEEQTADIKTKRYKDARTEIRADELKVGLKTDKNRDGQKRQMTLKSTDIKTDRHKVRWT